MADPLAERCAGCGSGKVLDDSQVCARCDNLHWNRADGDCLIGLTGECSCPQPRHRTYAEIPPQYQPAMASAMDACGF